MSFRQTRRVVTGHTPEGKAIILHDDYPEAVDPKTQKAPTDPHSPRLSLIHRTTGWPVNNQGPGSELDTSNLKRANPDGTLKGIVCEMVTFPPSDESKPFPLHRNLSMEYGVVLKGSCVLVLEDGVETNLNEGDVWVQRGTIHTWKNVTNEDCQYLVVLIPAQPVIVEATGEQLSIEKLAGLSD